MKSNCRTNTIALALLAAVMFANLLAVAADEAEQAPIAFGPYVQNVTHESAVICWLTLSGESKVKGPNGDEVVREYEQHERAFVRLEPSTRYEYDMLGDGSPEGRGSFTTFPREIEPFGFVVFGDTRSRHDIHERLVERIIKEKPLFVINTGDLVSDGRSIEDWEHFFRINRELMRTIPYYPALGNHEKDSPHYFDFFNLPGNERYYSYVVGDAFFLVLDTEGADYPTPGFIKDKEWFWANQNKDYMEKQKAWADRMLGLHKDAGFVFVVFHSPLFSAKRSRIIDAQLRREFWGGIFERHGVQVVFNGHDHHYHHALNNGTHYVVTGGGGAGLYDADAPRPETVKAVKIEHYIRIEVGKDETKLTAIDINGEVIDEFSVAKRKNGE